jgi:polysaccharide deacetylase family protein (PEP-CTERM system associated)
LVENILSIDVEEVFHGEYTRQYRQGLCYRTSDNIPLILKTLGEYDVKATFFMVGEIAKRFPEVINMILEKGHEVAFHGWAHEPLWRLTPERFREEVKVFKKLHPDCIGFRAPSFSLNNKTKWVLKILQEEGFKYDSSIFPTWTPLYGTYKAPTRPYHPSLANIIEEDGNCSIIEFPLAVYELFGLKVPIAGGFWLRLWSLDLVKRGIRKIDEKGFPAVVYIHNWELDEKTPKINAGILGRFQVYHNLNKAKQKLGSLLSEFNFTNFAIYIKDMLNSWA